MAHFWKKIHGAANCVTHPLEQFSYRILPVIRFTTTLEILEATNDSSKAKML